MGLPLVWASTYPSLCIGWECILETTPSGIKQKKKADPSETLLPRFQGHRFDPTVCERYGLGEEEGGFGAAWAQLSGNRSDANMCANVFMRGTWESSRCARGVPGGVLLSRVESGGKSEPVIQFIIYV